MQRPVIFSNSTENALPVGGRRPKLIPDFLYNYVPVDAVTSRFCRVPM